MDQSDIGQTIKT